MKCGTVSYTYINVSRFHVNSQKIECPRYFVQFLMGKHKECKYMYLYTPYIGIEQRVAEKQNRNKLWTSNFTQIRDSLKLKQMYL